MKKTLLLILIITTFKAFSQNVGINSTGAVPNASAILDVVSTNKGFLLPRVALTSTLDVATIAAANWLIVFNTATAGDVTPGMYYWDGAKWVRMLGNSDAWRTLGNVGTVAATNFLGTTDAIDLRFRTNNVERFEINSNNQFLGFNLGTAALPTFTWQADPNTGIFSPAADMFSLSTAGSERMRVIANGNVGINQILPVAQLEVSSGDVIQDAIYGHSNNVGGYLGRESNISFGTPVQTLSGSGVYAANPMAGYTSAYAQSTGAATVAANISFSDVWMASYNYVQNASAAFNPTANYNQLNVTNNGLGGYQIALRGYSDRDVVAGNPGWTVGIQGVAKAQNQWSYGVYGASLSSTTYSVGGYFSGSDFLGVNYAYAYVGGNVAGVARKISGTGTVNEIIPTENHGRVTLTCPESPEYWYQDYGTIEMINGKAHVDLDEILVDIIVVDDGNPIRTFFTPQDMLYFNGAAVINQTKTGFDIVELNGGTHSGKIQYQIIVKPKTSFGEGRFAQAPGASYLKPENEPESAKAKNQINDGMHIFRWPADHIVYKYNPEEMTKIGDIIPAGPNAGKTKLGNGKYQNGISATQIK